MKKISTTNQNEDTSNNKITNKEEILEYVDDQIIDELSALLIKKNIIAYKELAK